MALNKTTLATALENAIKEITATEDDTRKELAIAIANTVIDHFKNNAVITISAGITVATTGTSTAQTGATTSTGTGTIA